MMEEQEIMGFLLEENAPLTHTDTAPKKKSRWLVSTPNTENKGESSLISSPNLNNNKNNVSLRISDEYSDLFDDLDSMILSNISNINSKVYENEKNESRSQIGAKNIQRGKKDRNRQNERKKPELNGLEDIKIKQKSPNTLNTNLKDNTSEMIRLANNSDLCTIEDEDENIALQSECIRWLEESLAKKLRDLDVHEQALKYTTNNEINNKNVEKNSKVSVTNIEEDLTTNKKKDEVLETIRFKIYIYQNLVTESKKFPFKTPSGSEIQHQNKAEFKNLIDKKRKQIRALRRTLRNQTQKVGNDSSPEIIDIQQKIINCRQELKQIELENKREMKSSKTLQKQIIKELEEHLQLFLKMKIEKGVEGNNRQKNNKKVAKQPKNIESSSKKSKKLPTKIPDTSEKLEKKIITNNKKLKPKDRSSNISNNNEPISEDNIKNKTSSNVNYANNNYNNKCDNLNNSENVRTTLSQSSDSKTKNNKSKSDTRKVQELTEEQALGLNRQEIISIDNENLHITEKKSRTSDRKNNRKKNVVLQTEDHTNDTNDNAIENTNHKNRRSGKKIPDVVSLNNRSSTSTNENIHRNNTDYTKKTKKSNKKKNRDNKVTINIADKSAKNLKREDLFVYF
ncbi:hypothetical protein TBLA_0C01020 [Henningerozyma blattae CBS 6284]|uniref:Uncharacterized protein n=1 Tax=Henningerozyma blattae (strain ATCC 34711 / CBS 6284 / DSM 70876 / NBRC 10599 / NRRL Y-10934 / UCD 77-7) TaxID=1071380 RepID=I2H0L5_HENB6|nr:hypothetical protein TBLA_0C01020 [Tetrapisispora blattae CBS 6284]CCH59917.1 hypothetical protein TBLA_0C01020 [Tetrapisispora blattae CBS 6284]